MGDHVFICYAREDQEFVFKLVKSLKDRRVPVWLDQLDIRGGTNWNKSIDDAIGNCATLLVVLSPAAVDSEDVQGEWLTALGDHKPIVPVLCHACRIPGRLRVFQYIDFTARGLDDETILNQLVLALQAPESVLPKSDENALAAEAQLRQQALTARQQADQTQTAAEQADAQQYVRELYQRAIEAKKQGEQHLAVKRWKEAAEEFVRAQGFFAQASHSAQREKARQAAAVAYERMGEARAKAEQAKAQERFTAEFAQAQHVAAQAQACAEREEFVEAVGLYEQTEQHFEHLLQQAIDQAAQENAEAARQRMSEVKARVHALRPWAESLWAEAQQEENRAEQAYEAQTSEQAIAGYERASQAYEQVGVVGERLRQETLQTQQQAAAARAEAELAEAERYAAGPWSQAMAAQGEADRHWQAQQFAEAAQGYGQAQGLFQQAAEEARRERWPRQAVAAARQRLEERQTAAERAGAHERLGEVFTQAQRLGEQGRVCEERGDLVGALSAYEEATRSFVQLRLEAVLQVARERAEAARQRMEKVKKELEALGQWMGEKGAEATAQETAAARAWQAQDYEQAAAAYERARQLYEAARKEAAEAQLRQQALTARQQADQTQTAAEQADAQQYVRELYQRAIEAKKQGEQHLAVKRWKEAAEEFVRAQGFFAQASHSAQREKARQAAAVAYERMGEARAKAEQAKAQERFTAEFAQAQHVAAQAQACAEREEFVEAVGLYEQTEQHFEHLLQQAIDQAAQENAEAARQRMSEVKARVHALRPWAESLWAEAQQEENRAEQAYEAQTSEQAIAGYERASQAYEQVGVVGERLRQETLQTQQQAAAARAEAELAEAERYAAGPWSQAMAAQGEADRHWQAQQFAEAAQGYGQAQGLFQQAAEEARRERWPRQAVAAARQRLEERQTAAERAGAHERLGEVFTQAQRLGEQGRVCEERGDLVGALSAYEEATRSFVQLRLEAVLQVARERAEAARQRLEEVKQRLETLRQWTGPQFAVAQQEEAEAERAWQAQEYARAAVHYEQAGPLYEAARVEAEEEQARQRTLQAQRVQAEQAKAHALEVQRKVPTGGGWSLSIWWKKRQANKVLINGDRLFQQGKYVEAQASYEKAASLFAVLQPQVKEELSPVSRRSPWFSLSAVLVLWKRAHLTLFISLGCLAVIFGRSLYNLDVFQLLEEKSINDLPIRQSEKEIPKPPEKPPLKLSEPEVPSTPSKEKPSAPTQTQEKKGGEESPFAPPSEPKPFEPPPQEKAPQKSPPPAPKPEPEPKKPPPLPKPKEELPAPTPKPEPKGGEASPPPVEVPKKKEISKPPEKPPEPQVPSPKLKEKPDVPPQPSIPPSLSSISEAEVTAWLETYRRAWEGKDIDKLVQLGEIPASLANQLRDKLSTYGSFRVDLRDVDIQREGTGVTVSFTRVDTINGTEHVHPDRKVRIIEKQGGRLVSRQ